MNFDATYLFSQFYREQTQFEKFPYPSEYIIDNVLAHHKKALFILHTINPIKNLKNVYS